MLVTLGTSRVKLSFQRFNQTMKSQVESLPYTSLGFAWGAKKFTL